MQEKIAPPPARVVALLRRYGEELSFDVLSQDGYPDVNRVIFYDGDLALHVAAFRGAIEDVALLLDAGAQPNTSNADGWTVLHAAIAGKSPDCVAALLACGADPNFQGDWPLSPLKSALATEDGPIAKLLRDAGAVE